MNVLNKPEYSSLKLILIVAVIALIGYFVFFKGGDRGLDQSGKALNSAITQLNAEFSELPMMPATGDSIEVDFVSTNGAISVAAGGSEMLSTEIVFNITAHGDNAFIDASCRENGPNIAGQGIEYTVLNKNKNTTACSITSGADSVGTGSAMKFRVNEEETEQFVLNLSVTPQASHTTQIFLNSINWTTNEAAVANFFFNSGFGPTSEFKTESFYLNF